MFRAFTASGALRQTFIDRILSLSLLRVSKSLSKIGCTKRAFLKRRVRRISFGSIHRINTFPEVPRVGKHRTCEKASYVCASLCRLKGEKTVSGTCRECEALKKISVRSENLNTAISNSDLSSGYFVKFSTPRTYTAMASCSFPSVKIQNKKQNENDRI